MCVAFCTQCMSTSTIKHRFLKMYYRQALCSALFLNQNYVSTSVISVCRHRGTVLTCGVGEEVDACSGNREDPGVCVVSATVIQQHLVEDELLSPAHGVNGVIQIDTERHVKLARHG